jgi:hypothetical protein
MVVGSLQVSFTTKTGRHEIAEILLKVVLNTKNQINLLLWIHHIATSGALMVGFICLPTKVGGDIILFEEKN